MGTASRIRTASRGWQLLRVAALIYAIGLVAHTADHFRRGIEILTPGVLWAGSFSSTVALGAIVLALTNHRLAPAVAAAHGLTQAIGVAAVHLIVAQGPFSDSLTLGGADVVSWAAVLLEIGSALALGLAGVAILARGARRPWPVDAVAHPAAPGPA
jgi:hypothetical protein